MLNSGVCMGVERKAEGADQAAWRVGLLPDARGLKLVFVSGVVESDTGGPGCPAVLSCWRPDTRSLGRRGIRGGL